MVTVRSFFCAEEIGSADSSSPEATPSHAEVPAEASSPAVMQAMQVDSTIPEGHSWNAGRPDERTWTAEGSHSVWDDAQEGFARVRSLGEFSGIHAGVVVVSEPGDTTDVSHVLPLAAGGSGADPSGYHGDSAPTVFASTEGNAPLRDSSAHVGHENIASSTVEAESLNVVAVILHSRC